MKIEIIERNNKKVLKKIKKDGSITYSMKGAYLGTDKKTGKQVTTTISAPTLKALDRKYLETKRKFEENDSTRKEFVNKIEKENGKINNRINTINIDVIKKDIGLKLELSKHVDLIKYNNIQ